MSETATVLVTDDTVMAVNDLPVPTGLRDHETAQRRNAERGLFAGVGVVAYSEQVGTDSEPLEQTLADLLGDLMHLCDAMMLSFEDLLDRGRFHYLAEITGEG